MGWRLHLRCLCSKRACVLHVFWKSSHPVLLLWHWQQSGFPDFLRQTSRVNMGRYGSKFDKNSRKKWTVDVYPQKSENDWDIVCGSLCEKILQFDPDTHLPTWVCRLKIGYWRHFPVKAATLGSTPENGTPKWTDSVPVPLYLGVKTMISLVNCSLNHSTQKRKKPWHVFSSCKKTEFVRSCPKETQMTVLFLGDSTQTPHVVLWFVTMDD